MDTIKKTIPGIHIKFDLAAFSIDEQKILNRLKSEWFLTSSGASRGPKIKLGSSGYSFFLMKPTTLISEMFNFEREIICVFSPYPTFEPRTLDAFDAVRVGIQDLRTENICCILISKDNNIESKIENLLKSDPEQPVVIPFTYSELCNNYDQYHVRNRFKKHFYTRDLFSFLSPLKKDLYFFGRSALVHELVNRHRAGEHGGLFGLRKSGKTSIIYAVERLMQLNNECFVSIDCESPSIHMLRWYELLHKIVLLYQKSKSSKIKIHDIGEYTEKTAADLFSEDMIKVYSSKKLSSSMLIFDEIERISPKTGSSRHWTDGDDFVFFWQSLRGFYQRNPEVFTYLVVGTNPSSVEQSMFGNHENPLFSSISAQYVPPFSLEQVREMIRKLGKYMGMKFDELLFSKMTEDFGGHPFLIRLFCSQINKMVQSDRPVIIDKALYDKAKAIYMDSSSDFLDMIVTVLQSWYPDEYDMLTFLANNDVKTFNNFAAAHTSYTKHLIGYGLIQSSPNGYSFNIESIKDYISKRHKYEKIHLNNEEKLQEITARRNMIEMQLRGVIRNALRMTYGINAGKQLSCSIPENRRDTLGRDIDVLLSKDKSPLFLLDLVNIINKEWSCFQNIFNLEKPDMLYILNEINIKGRPDAHAKEISKNDFIQIRLHFTKLEKILAEWII